MTEKKKDGPLREKTLKFAIRIVKLQRHLVEEKNFRCRRNNENHSQRDPDHQETPEITHNS